MLLRFLSRIIPSGALEALRRAFGFAVPNVLMQATSIRLRTSISTAVPLVVRITLRDPGAWNLSVAARILSKVVALVKDPRLGAMLIQNGRQNRPSIQQVFGLTDGKLSGKSATEATIRGKRHDRTEGERQTR